MCLNTSAMVCQKHVFLALRAHRPHSRPHTLNSPLCCQTQAARALCTQGFELSLLPKPFPPASTRDYRRPQTTRERARQARHGTSPSRAGTESLETTCCTCCIQHTQASGGHSRKHSTSPARSRALAGGFQARYRATSSRTRTREAPAHTRARTDSRTRGHVGESGSV